ncbi:hypothetical protein QUA51_09820 [Microcoleus sp. Pol10_D6]|uniref:hypothetical protein n=1 Tax=Microcoleus sp. Pol10_D6 TaxID=2818875 RepID=UPI002FD0CAF9
MTSRTMHVTNHYGESVRVEVINYGALTTDDITVDNNDTRSLEIIGEVYGVVGYWNCELKVIVYKIGEDTPKEERTIQPGKNEVNIIITKGNTSPVILVE